MNNISSIGINYQSINRDKREGYAVVSYVNFSYEHARLSFKEAFLGQRFRFIELAKPGTKKTVEIMNLEENEGSYSFECALVSIAALERLRELVFLGVNYQSIARTPFSEGYSVVSHTNFTYDHAKLSFEDPFLGHRFRRIELAKPGIERKDEIEHLNELEGGCAFSTALEAREALKLLRELREVVDRVNPCKL